jgi:O-methyltransferase
MFDTFEGMSAPTNDDFDHKGVMASDREDAVEGAVAVGLDQVTFAMRSTGYVNFRCVKGMVESTLPGNAPDRISILRLDTDFYESTRHELAHLYHRVSPGGIVFVDDYGHWMGCKKAVDEFLAALPVPVFLHRVTYTVRAFTKPEVDSQK